MLRRRNMIMIIKNEHDGFVRRKEIRTYRSCLAMLKHLRKQELKTDPGARIMQLGGVPTLVIHRTEAPGVVTVRLVEKETE